MIALTVNCSIGVEKKLLAHSSITPEENRAKRKNILIIVMALVTWLTCRFREGPPKNASLLMMFPPPERGNMVKEMAKVRVPSQIFVSGAVVDVYCSINLLPRLRRGKIQLYQQ